MLNANRCPTCGQRTDRATYEQKKRFYALVALILEKLEGKWSKEEVSDHLKMKFLGGAERQMKSGKTVTILPSLAGLDTQQMAEFQDQCEAYCLEKYNIWLDE